MASHDYETIDGLDYCKQCGIWSGNAQPECPRAPKPARAAVATWVIDEALYLCREIEKIATDHGAHVALTGGLLYKDGPRKDADIVLYRIRDKDCIDVPKLFRALRDKLGVHLKGVLDEVWCVKATWNGKPIDFFFPEAEEGDYPPAEDDDDVLDDEARTGVMEGDDVSF